MSNHTFVFLPSHTSHWADTSSYVLWYITCLSPLCDPALKQLCDYCFAENLDSAHRSSAVSMHRPESLSGILLLKELQSFPELSHLMSLRGLLAHCRTEYHHIRFCSGHLI